MCSLRLIHKQGVSERLADMYIFESIAKGRKYEVGIEPN